jgi:hypothetical protein
MHQALDNLNAITAAMAASPPAGTLIKILGQGAQGWVLKVQLESGTQVARKVSLN